MVFLVMLLSAAGVTAILKPTYMSSVEIQVRKDVKDINPLGEIQREPGFDPYFINTEFKKIQSTSVLYPVIEDPKLGLIDKWSQRLGLKGGQKLTKQEAYRYLLHNMEVRQVRNTSLIEIRVYSPDRFEAAQIANAIARSYKRWRESVRTEHITNALAILKQDLDRQTAKVEQMQKQLDELRRKYNIPDIYVNTPIPYQSSPERERVSALAQEWTRAQADFINYRTKYHQLIALTNDPVRLREAILTMFPYENLLPQLMSSLSTVEQNLAKLSKQYGEEHPQVVETRALRDKIEEQIRRRVDGILKGVQANMLASSNRMVQIKVAMEEGKAEVARQAEQWSKYFLAKRDLENEQRIRDALLLKTIQEQIDLKIPSESAVQIVQPAEPSLRPVRPRWGLNLAIGGLLGLAIGVMLAFFIEYLDISVKTIDDVERALGSSVLGVIPQNVGLLIKDGPDASYAEAYRVLRTNVLFSRKDPEANTLSVVSAGAGEGKTTTVMNLATTFAQSGDRVLLVDSDLRRPALHKMLGVSNRIGLTDYLLQQKSLEEVIQTTPLPNMDFLPSGKLPSSALGILNSERMKQFIEEVKSRYDFVFFDSPPIMGVSDASIIARLVDMSLMVVQYRKYPQAMTVRAKNMVEKVGAHLLGIVLNNINISQDSYYYYYSGYYYDYYYSYRYEGDKYGYDYGYGYGSRRRRRRRPKKSTAKKEEASQTADASQPEAQPATMTAKESEETGASGEDGLKPKF